MSIRVLFLCTGNSVRSQMAEHLLRALGGDRFEVFSAGIQPRGVHPLTIEVLAEAGIDVSQAESKHLTQFLNQQFDYIITVCDKARDQCPTFPGDGRNIHWSFDDPAAASGGKDKQIKAFRRIYNELSNRLRIWIAAVDKQEKV